MNLEGINKKLFQGFKPLPYPERKILSRNDDSLLRTVNKQEKMLNMSDLNNYNEETCDFANENKEKLKIESFYFAKWVTLFIWSCCVMIILNQYFLLRHQMKKKI